MLSLMNKWNFKDNKKIIFNGTEENLYKTLLLGGLNQN